MRLTHKMPDGFLMVVLVGMTLVGVTIKSTGTSCSSMRLESMVSLSGRTCSCIGT